MHKTKRWAGIGSRGSLLLLDFLKRSRLCVALNIVVECAHLNRTKGAA
jgi:hypothetical protein